jgi:hypothetical protein
MHGIDSDKAKFYDPAKMYIADLSAPRGTFQKRQMRCAFGLFSAATHTQRSSSAAAM